MQTIVETPTFLLHAKQAGVSDAERAGIVEMIAGGPESGDLIPGTGGARKVRFAKPGKGKSGSYRIITFYTAPDVPVFLLDVYGKGEKANLSQREKTIWQTFSGKSQPPIAQARGSRLRRYGVRRERNEQGRRTPVAGRERGVGLCAGHRG